MSFCSFCGKSEHDVGAMMEGPGDVYICWPCVMQAKRVIEFVRAERWCSFCGNSSREAGPFAEGPNHVYVCSSCVDAGLSVMEADRG